MPDTRDALRAEDRPLVVDGIEAGGDGGGAADFQRSSVPKPVIGADVSTIPVDSQARLRAVLLGLNLSRSMWSRVGICVIVAAVGALFWVYRQPAVYTAEAKVVLRHPKSDSAFERLNAGFRDENGMDRELETEKQASNVDANKAAVAAELGDRWDDVETLSAEPITSTDVIAVEAQATTSSSAIEAADSFADVLLSNARGAEAEKLEHIAAALRRSSDRTSAEVQELDEEIAALVDAALVGDELASELARAAVAERIALTNYAATTETYAEFSDIDAQLRSGGMRRLQDAVIVGGPTRPGVWRPLGLSLLLGAALGFALAQLEVIVRSGRKSVQGGVN
ncbi:MAG: hypothetical protein KDB86_12325 [Actinobacteria bacterium]|nr:hypothetical protein [Actinomycetota bacterium]